MSKKKVLLRGVFINRDTNGEGVLKVGTTLIRVSTVMGILYHDGETTEYAKKAIVQECEKCKAQLEKSGTKYKILSENMILLEKCSKKIRRIYFSEDLS